MLHLIKYRFLCMIRNRSLLFWSFLFPMILTTLFSLVFSNAFTMQTFETIPIAIVNTEGYKKDIALQETLTMLYQEDTPLFDVNITSQKDADALLEDDKVDAVVLRDESVHIKVHKTGMKQTITQTFFDEYLQKGSMIQNLIQKGSDVTTIMETLSETTSYIASKDIDNAEIASVFFYTVLAMNALFGGYWSINSMFELQANQSSRAARICVAPTHKAKNLLCDFILNFVFQLTFLGILLAYMMLILDISFGPHVLEIFLLLAVGSIAGNSLGVFIGSHFAQANYQSKSGILTSVTMLGSFLAGMMIVQMKYIVQVYVPIVGYINPVNMITDGLYALYYYGVDERFYLNVVSLGIFAFVCYSTSYISLRRQQYQSLEAR